MFFAALCVTWAFVAQAQPGSTKEPEPAPADTPATSTDGGADAEGEPGTTEDDAVAQPGGVGSTVSDDDGTSDDDGGAAPAPELRPEQDMDAGTYAVRLRDLEQRINELKEQVFRSKARLSLLAETVLQGVVAGAQAVLSHENRMSSSYKLVKAVYALDGAPIFSKADEEGGLGERNEFDVYNGSIVPGEHVLTVNLEYRGHGYGIFSYLKGYRFKVRSTYSFHAPEGKTIRIRVVGYEKGGPTAPLEERPAIRYIERLNKNRGKGGK